MNGIWVAVKATTSVAGSSRNTTLKLWKSRPAAPMIRTRRAMPGSFPSPKDGCDAREGPRGRAHQRPRARSSNVTLLQLCGAREIEPAVRTDHAERRREVIHADPPSIAACAPQDQAARGGPEEPVKVVARYPFRVRHLDRQVQEIPRDEERFVAVSDEYGAVAGRVTWRVD